MAKIRVQWFGNQYTRGLYAHVDKKEVKLANRLAEAVRRNAPVLTGALKRSIKVVKVKLMNYRVKTTVPYARFVEYGTSKMSPQPYFRPALKQVKGLR